MKEVQDPTFAEQKSSFSWLESDSLGVLVVEDHQETREMLALVVQGMGHRVYTATNGREALQELSQHPVDIVLLDVMMPEVDGLEFCRRVQADQKLQPLHIIMVSARDTLEDKVQGLSLGAADYLTKPFSLAELKARIGVAQRLVIAQRQLRRQKALLEQMVREDGLTGLYNRRYFEERAQEEWLRAQRYRRPLSLLLGDLDHFKKINDRYGHAWGDRVLKEVGQVLHRHCRRTDIAARLGGEEFAVLLLETRLEGARKVAARLGGALRVLAFDHPLGAFQISMSFGVASLESGHAQSFSRFLEEADKALYRAKNRGRDRVEVWSGD